jgi:hypothetical protein
MHKQTDYYINNSPTEARNHKRRNGTLLFQILFQYQSKSMKIIDIYNV